MTETAAARACAACGHPVEPLLLNDTPIVTPRWCEACADRELAADAAADHQRLVEHLLDRH